MTKQEAFNILNQALASIPATRAQHAALIQALNILMSDTGTHSSEKKAGVAE